MAQDLKCPNHRSRYTDDSDNGISYADTELTSFKNCDCFRATSARQEGRQMSLWGWKEISRRISSGVFVCPAEATERAYWVFRVRRWFTVLSVPVIPGELVGTHAECFCCEKTYDVQMLAPSVPDLA